MEERDTTPLAAVDIARSRRLSQPTERYGAGWSSFHDAGGRPIEPPGVGGWRAYVRERLHRWRLAVPGSHAGAAHDDVPSYQIQLLLESDDPVSPADEALGRAFFARVRAALLHRAPGGTGG